VNKQEMDNLLSKELLTVPDVMRLLQVSYSTVYNRIMDCTLEAFNANPDAGRSHWRIWTRSVKKLMGIDEQIPA
jgi:hypothetical protein